MRVAPVTTTSPVITAAPKPSCQNIQPIAGSFAVKTAYVGLIDGNPSSNMTLTWAMNGACVSSYTVETYRNKDKVGGFVVVVFTSCCVVSCCARCVL